MILISYILAAGLELVLISNSFEMERWSFVWAYGFLFLLTMLSIHTEDTKAGKNTRAFFKTIGVNSKIYDYYTNFGKIFAYGFVLNKDISYFQGLIFAYGISFLGVVLLFFDYSKKLEKKTKEYQKKKAKMEKLEKEKEKLESQENNEIEAENSEKDK